MPLLSNFVVCSKKGVERYLVPRRDGSKLSFAITPDLEKAPPNPSKGWKRGTSGVFECAFCATVTKRDYVAEQATSKGLGKIGLATVVQLGRKREYVEFDGRRLDSIEITEDHLDGLDSEFSPNPRDLWCRNFGLTRPHKLYTERQLLLLCGFADDITVVRNRIINDAKKNDRLAQPKEYAKAVCTLLGLAVSKLADYNSSLVVWSPSRSQAKSTFARQALPFVWDFAEVNPFANAAGDLTVTIQSMCRVIEASSIAKIPGIACQQDVTQLNDLHDTVVSTDPPYYDNISYADLSDFFYVWLRRGLKGFYPNELGTMMVPKVEELVAQSYRFDGSGQQAKEFFEDGLGRAFSKIYAMQSTTFPFAVFYAFKQAEHRVDSQGRGTTTSTGWETMLEGVLRAGFCVTGTWLLTAVEYIQQSILANDFGLRDANRRAAERETERILNANHWNWFGYIVRRDLNPKYFCGLPNSVELHDTDALILHRLKSSPWCPFLQSLTFMRFGELEMDCSNGEVSYSAGQSGLGPLRGGDFRNVRKLAFKPTRWCMNRDSFEFISELKSLESLELRSRLSDDSLGWLFNCPLPNLKELVIVSEIGDEGARVLAESRWFKQIQSLELLCFMTDVGARSIAENMDPNTLRHLDVIGNRLTQTGINQLKRTGISSLETIGQTREN